MLGGEFEEGGGGFADAVGVGGGLDGDGGDVGQAGEGVGVDGAGVVGSACVGEGGRAFESVLEALGRDDLVELVEVQAEPVAQREVWDLGVDEVEEEGVEVGVGEVGGLVCVLFHAASLAGWSGDARGGGGMYRKQRTDAVDRSEIFGH